MLSIDMQLFCPFPPLQDSIAIASESVKQIAADMMFYNQSNYLYVCTCE